jgi:hypothetical protein
MNELLKHYDNKIESIENKQRMSIEIVKAITDIGSERPNYEILCKHMKKIMKYDECIQKYINKKIIYDDLLYDWEHYKFMNNL